MGCPSPFQSFLPCVHTLEGAVFHNFHNTAERAISESLLPLGTSAGELGSSSRYYNKSNEPHPFYECSNIKGEAEGLCDKGGSDV